MSDYNRKSSDSYTPLYGVMAKGEAKVIPQNMGRKAV